MPTSTATTELSEPDFSLIRLVNSKPNSCACSCSGLSTDTEASLCVGDAGYRYRVPCRQASMSASAEGTTSVGWDIHGGGHSCMDRSHAGCYDALRKAAKKSLSDYKSFSKFKVTVFESVPHKDQMTSPDLKAVYRCR